MKASIHRQITTVTTSVVTTKVTTKDVEVRSCLFDSDNEYISDTRDESLSAWEKARKEEDDEEENGEEGE